MTNFSKALHSPRTWGTRLVLAVLGSLSIAPMAAFACTGQHSSGGGGGLDLVIDAWQDAASGEVISNWRSAGNANFLEGCSTSAVPLDITPSLAGLVFIRNVTVDGVAYPAFGFSGQPRSPLLIFQHTTWSGNGGVPSVSVPLDISKPTHLPGAPMGSNLRGSYISVAAVARGGIMQSVATTPLGSVSHVSPRYPLWVKTDTFTVTANIKVPTCSVFDTPVTLQEVPFGDLPSVGSHARELAFDVAMDCNGAFPIEMKLTDANAPGNTGSRLTPTANATAGAVRVELLREGTPVVLGDTWTIPVTQDGRQNVRLAARYYREAGTFRAGVVEGQAVITATYR